MLHDQLRVCPHRSRRLPYCFWGGDARQCFGPQRPIKAKFGHYRPMRGGIVKGLRSSKTEVSFVVTSAWSDHWVALFAGKFVSVNHLHSHVLSLIDRCLCKHATATGSQWIRSFLGGKNSRLLIPECDLIGSLNNRIQFHWINSHLFSDAINKGGKLIHNNDSGNILSIHCTVVYLMW